jgi:hypothetical protein
MWRSPRVCGYLRFRQGHNIISANAHIRYLNGHIGASLRKHIGQTVLYPDICPLADHRSPLNVALRAGRCAVLGGIPANPGRRLDRSMTVPAGLAVVAGEATIKKR